MLLFCYENYVFINEKLIITEAPHTIAYTFENGAVQLENRAKNNFIVALVIKSWQS